MLVWMKNGQFFVYTANDFKHFIFSLFFIQSIGEGAAFNGPEWSLTIEIILYAFFYLVARLGLLQNPLFSFGAVLFGCFYYFSFHRIPQGISGFFLGGLLVWIHQYADQRARTTLFILACITAASWSIVVYYQYFGSLVTLSERAASSLVIYFLFPTTILFAIFYEKFWETHVTSLSFLGEASYSSYLIHFPMQLVIAIAVDYRLLKPSAAQSNLCFMCFFAVLMPLSIYVNRRFEMPAMRWVRSAIIKSSRTGKTQMSPAVE